MSISKMKQKRNLGMMGKFSFRFNTLSVVFFIAMIFLSSYADAKRLGGGRSFGYQSRSLSQQYRLPYSRSMNSTQQATSKMGGQNIPPSSNQSLRNRWLGPVAGLIGGLGLAALLSHFGLTGVFANALSNMVGMVLIGFGMIWFIRYLIHRRDLQPVYSKYSKYSNNGKDHDEERRTYGNNIDFLTKEVHVDVDHHKLPGNGNEVLGDFRNEKNLTKIWGGVPANFDRDSFLRTAKVHFIRLQTAWDAGNLNDIREFTTPEMYAETHIELVSRGSVPNYTDIVHLEAEFLGIEELEDRYIASVRYSGLIREDKDVSAKAFDEIWNLARQKSGSEKWLLAGIQQTDNKTQVQ